MLDVTDLALLECRQDLTERESALIKEIRRLRVVILEHALAITDLEVEANKLEERVDELEDAIDDHDFATAVRR